MNACAPLPPEAFRLFENLFLETFGMHLDWERNPSFEFALSTRLRQRGFKSYQEYYDFIRFHSEGSFELRELVDLITVKETHFFRNKTQFDVLMEYVLPEIIQRKEKSGERRIRCWSAGCATGDEAYSLAIVLREVLPWPSEWSVSILGTDINRNGLAMAKKGVYERGHLVSLPQFYLQKYFKSQGLAYVLHSEIKEMVQFEDHNLVKDPFTDERMRDLDFIFCRNVLIYLNEMAMRRIIDNFYYCLTPSGYLFLGHAEILWQRDHQFETVLFPQTFIYRKRPNFPIKRDPLPKGKEALRTQVQLEAPPVRNTLSLAAQWANEAKYQEAVDLLKKIISDEPLSLEAHYLLGVIYQKEDFREEAKVQFRKVLYLDPNVASAYFHLGYLYLREGSLKEASRLLRKAVHLLQKRPKGERAEFFEEVTVEFLLKTCKDTLMKISREGT
ncbi:MAG: CheR family methyltransferase [Thermodesulfobacteriota bacterium]